MDDGRNKDVNKLTNEKRLVGPDSRCKQREDPGTFCLTGTGSLYFSVFLFFWKEGQQPFVPFPLSARDRLCGGAPPQ